MELPQGLSVGKGFVRFAPHDIVVLREGITLISCAIAFCREQNHRRLLVNVIDLTGFGPPTVGERYWIAQEWARMGAGHIVIAIVARPEFIHPEKLGVFVASQAGLNGDVFTAESEAMEWLMSQ